MVIPQEHMWPGNLNLTGKGSLPEKLQGKDIKILEVNPHKVSNAITSNLWPSNLQILSCILEQLS